MLTIVGTAPGRPEKTPAVCQAADRALAERRFDSARTQYEDCLKEGPARFETLSNLGIVYAELGQFDQAVKAYQQALALNPNNPHLQLNLGLALLKSGRSEEAASAFARTLVFDPGNPKTEELLALCHYQMQQYALAAVEAERVHKALPEEASAAFLLGSAYLKLDLYQQAIPLIDLALRKTKSAETHVILGEAYLGIKAYREALGEFSKALAMNPKLPGIHSEIGTAVAGLGNTDMAIAEYEKELATNPNDFEANYFLGRLKRLANDPEAAKNYLAKAEHLRPGDPSVQYEYCVFALQAKDYEKAETLLKRILEKYPNYKDAHVLLSEVYFKTRRREEGEREKVIVEALKKTEQERHAQAGKTGEAYGGTSSPGKTNQ